MTAKNQCSMAKATVLKLLRKHFDFICSIQGYFIKSKNDGSEETSWWNGNPAHHVDFTQEGARKWFTDRLKTLQELHGIDSFKFDAGESDWAPPNPDLNADIEDSPNALTSAYVRTCAEFGGLLEVRSAWR